MTFPDLKPYLDEKVAQYNRAAFIPDDPICIPHAYSKVQDIEIAGLFAATLAWGQRKTIIAKCRELMHYMDDRPHQFIVNHSEQDLKSLMHFKHRTFNTTDLLYFIHSLKAMYSNNDTLEGAFCFDTFEDDKVENGLNRFYQTFFGLPDAPARTAKHVASPAKKSACKRLNMFLRWMIRRDEQGVDFGIWHSAKPSDLMCPLDVHVDRIARNLGLITRKQTDWLTTQELTAALRTLDPDDPVKYDYALFGIGVMEKPFG